MSSDQLSESVQGCFLGAAANASSTPLVSTYVHGGLCRSLDFYAMIAAGDAADADAQVTVEMLMASDSSGTGAEAILFQDLYLRVGATELIDGPNVDTRVEMTQTANVYDANGTRGKVSSYDIPVAHGDKEIQIHVPIRSRMRDLVSSKPWVAMRITTGLDARAVTFFAAKYQPDYGREAGTKFFS